MCRQGRIRLSAPTTPRGRERLRSSVSRKKRRETTIKPPRTSQRQPSPSSSSSSLFEHRSIRDSDWPILFTPEREEANQTNKIDKPEEQDQRNRVARQQRMQRYSRRSDETTMPTIASRAFRGASSTISRSSNTERFLGSISTPPGYSSSFRPILFVDIDVSSEMGWGS
ncbi:synaptic transmission protein complexin isoform X1 [Halictus rubicundus]|uniref:synaptic transmission protein complexin isoform X1 n=1 Tax=Halictus rubicundus TaxID=77578 RepID=UPI004035AD96